MFRHISYGQEILMLKFLTQVRYQSRKRLAEQRPRVKGQIVRQVHDDHPVAGGGVAPEI